MQGRIRSVKPEIHLDEDLWDAEQETGLPLFRAFVGLWNYADREGRFEWRPRPLKAAILPYWEGDFSRVLDALATRDFVIPYRAGTRALGVVRTFLKHQVVNNREKPSELPEPPFDPSTLTRGARVLDASPTPLVHAPVEGKGREGKGGEDACAREASGKRPVSSFDAARHWLEDSGGRQHAHGSWERDFRIVASVAEDAGQLARLSAHFWRPDGWAQEEIRAGRGHNVTPAVWAKHIQRDLEAARGPAEVDPRQDRLRKLASESTEAFEAGRHDEAERLRREADELSAEIYGGVANA